MLGSNPARSLKNQSLCPLCHGSLGLENLSFTSRARWASADLHFKVVPWLSLDVVKTQQKEKKQNLDTKILSQGTIKSFHWFLFLLF